MANLDALRALSGGWQGTTELWFEPGDPAASSPTSATVEGVGGGKLVVVRYDWEFESNRHDGLLLIGRHEDEVEVAWCDSFHMDSRIMSLRGEILEGGGFRASGEYEVGDGPDWGWSIEVTVDGAEAFTVVMHNVTPGGEALPAVRAVYQRDEAGR